MDSPGITFFKKIFGSFFFPTRTFESLSDEEPASAVLYALILGGIFLALLYILIMVWPGELNGLIEGWDKTIGSEILGGDHLPSSMYAWIYTFRAALVGCTLLVAIPVIHALVWIKTQSMPPGELRVRPRPALTAIVVLDCSAPLFFFSLIPIVGYWIGLAWFSFVIENAATAYYGNIHTRTKWSSIHYPCMFNRTGGFILVTGFFLWLVFQIVFGSRILV